MQKRVWSKYAIMLHDMRETFFNAEIFVREESGTSKHFEDNIFQSTSASTSDGMYMQSVWFHFTVGSQK